MKILISGALGFMGREVAAQAAKLGFEIACGVDVAPGAADFPLYTTFEDCPPVDVIVDFSTWKPGADLLTYALKYRIPAVIATTGLSEEQLAAIDEAHHNRKADAPSGTALMLLDAVKEGCESEREAVFGRHGRDCKRQPKEIGVHALRGGTVTGEHEVCFFGTSERVKISHSAENRSVFAAGALKAAAFLVGQKPGMYSMDDVVGKL